MKFIYFTLIIGPIIFSIIFNNAFLGGESLGFTLGQLGLPAIISYFISRKKENFLKAFSLFFFVLFIVMFFIQNI